MASKIKIEDLKKLCKKILNITETFGFEEIDLNKTNIDFYWTIRAEDREKLGIPEPIIGSLYNDTDQLNKILSGKAPITSSDFSKIASLLIAIDQELQKEKVIFIDLDFLEKDEI